MRYIKQLLLMTVIINILTTMVFGESRSYEDVKNVALNWANQHQRTVGYTIESDSIDEPLLFDELDGYNDNSDEKEYYIVKLQPKGWVIVSGDDIAKPILGYSFDSDMNKKEPLSPAFIDWMNGIKAEINQGRLDGIGNKSNTKEWSNFAVEPEVFMENLSEKKVSTSTHEVVPLLTTRWNQGRYYNEMCPIDTHAGAGNNHVYVGCVATAMVQIMKFHSWPSRGVGSHSYTHRTYGEQSVDFETDYNWSAMPNSLRTPNSDIAKISYHAGVSVNMNYGPHGSGAGATSPDNAWKNHFNYTTIGPIWKSRKTDEEWHTLLKTDLDNRLPIYYCGSGSGGHAFVCDGYRYAESLKMYHFNWGWGGYSNGWYAMNALNPADRNYSRNNIAIFGVTPNRIGTELIPPTDLTASSITPNSVQLTWSDNSNNERGFKIYRGDTEVASVGANIHTYSVTRLTANRDYTYSVKAFNANEISSATTVSFRTPAVPIETISFNRTLNGNWDRGTNSIHRGKSYAKFYKFTLTERSKVTIDLISSIDTYMFLLNGANINGSVNEENDDGNEYNSRIIKTLPAGTYTIEATTYDSNKRGAFTLRVSVAPIAPTNLSVSSITSGSAQLTWRDNSNDEHGFKIYKGTTEVATVGANIHTYIIRGLTPNTNYTYSVKAFNSGGISRETTVRFKTAAVSITPISLNRTINGTWDSETHSIHRSGSYAKFYKFTLRESRRVTIDLMSSVDTYLFLLNGVNINGSINARNDDGGYRYNSRITKTLPAGTYTIEATTYSANRIGAFTLRVSVAPNAPTNLSASSITSNSVQFRWRDHSYNESGFKGYLNGHSIGTLPRNRTSAHLSGLIPNTNYTFYIKAIDGTTESLPSNVIHFRTLPSSPFLEKSSREVTTSGIKLY